MRYGLYLLCLLACDSLALASTNPMQAGAWHVVATMRLRGVLLPLGTRTREADRCWGKQDMAKLDQLAAHLVGDEKSKCTVWDAKLSGNQLAWKMRCEDKVSGEGFGRATLAADHYVVHSEVVGVANPKVWYAPGKVTFIVDYDGARAGDCTPPAAAAGSNNPGATVP